MIILSDGNLKKLYVTVIICNRIQIIASSCGKTIQQNEETCIGYSQMFSANDSSMNGTWNSL